MKKIISIIGGVGLALVFSISIASAQQVCVSAGGQPGTIQGSICIPTGGNNGGYTTCPNGTRVPQGYACAGTTAGNPVYGTPAYTQGMNTRQVGSQQADLGFIANLVLGLKQIVNWLPPLLLGIAVVVFFFYLIRYLIAGKNDPAEKQKNLKTMIYALVAIFIMVTLWGIIAFFGDALGINPNVQVSAPTLPQ